MHRSSRFVFFAICLFSRFLRTLCEFDLHALYAWILLSRRRISHIAGIVTAVCTWKLLSGGIGFDDTV